MAASLSGVNAASPGSVNLSTEGTTDWAHWGLTNAASFDHKAAVTPQISNFTQLGTTAANRFQAPTGARVAYTWTGGTPTASATNTTTGLYINGTIGNGFSLSVPANTTTKTLRLYVGSWFAQGRLQATLSDGSAAQYVTFVDAPSGLVDRLITLNFSAASAGQTLNIQYTMFTDYGSGNVTLSAATLVSAGSPNQPQVFNPPSYTFTLPENSSNGTAVGTVTATDPDAGNTISYAILGDTGSVFAINASSGAITVANSAALNFETTPTFNLQAQATDNLGASSVATLTINLTNVNEPPDQATIGNRSISEGALLSFTVTATDPDTGDIPVMTSSTLPGTATYIDNHNGTATFNWTPASGASAASPYSVTFTATSSGALFDQETISITVNAAAAGTLSGVNAASPGSVNLSTEGTTDWAHWGLTNAASFDHKAAVTPQISNFTQLGTTAANRFQAPTGARVAYTWTGGTPTASATNTTTGLYINGTIGNGFSLSVPANTTTKTLRLYVGSWFAQGRLQATLSDGSAAQYVTFVDAPSGLVDRLITLNFSAASAGQTLNIQYTMFTDYGSGNVTLSAATLVSAGSPNQPPVFNPPSYTFTLPENSSNGTAVGTVTATDPDAGNTISYADPGGYRQRLCDQCLQWRHHGRQFCRPEFRNHPHL